MSSHTLSFYPLCVSLIDRPFDSANSGPSQNGQLASPWNCSYCTYENRNSSSSCEICGLPKDQEWGPVDLKIKNKMKNTICYDILPLWLGTFAFGLAVGVESSSESTLRVTSNPVAEAFFTVFPWHLLWIEIEIEEWVRQMLTSISLFHGMHLNGYNL